MRSRCALSLRVEPPPPYFRTEGEPPAERSVVLSLVCGRGTWLWGCHPTRPALAACRSACCLLTHPLQQHTAAWVPSAAHKLSVPRPQHGERSAKAGAPPGPAASSSCSVGMGQTGLRETEPHWSHVLWDRASQHAVIHLPCFLK